MISHILIWIALVGIAASGDTPSMQWDPDTAKDCAGWYDNGGDLSCEDVRKMFGISPSEFHAWNPSVGLDCKPWDLQSYCIITQEKMDTVPAINTISGLPVPTKTHSSTSTTALTEESPSTATDGSDGDAATTAGSGESVTTTTSIDEATSSPSPMGDVKTGAAARNRLFR